MKNKIDLRRLAAFLCVMSILIALITGCALAAMRFELYSLQSDLNKLNQKLETCSEGSEEKEKVEAEIKKCQIRIANLKKEIKEAEDFQKAFRDATITQTEGCFPAETLVLLHNNTFKPIIELRLGDLVQTYGINSGKLTVQPVIDLYRHRTDHFYLINSQLRVTGSQPLLTNRNTWKKVQALSVGEKIQSKGEIIEIQSITKQMISQDVYNLKVQGKAGKHNYLVSPDSKTIYVVHNGGNGGK